MDDSSIVLVTGANSGLGKAACIAFARLGWHVIMLCRDKKRGEESLGEVRVQSGNRRVELMLCDLSSIKSIESFAEEFLRKYVRLDVLVNNAGTLKSCRCETQDGIELQFGVNHLGAFILTHRLLPLLTRSAPSRVINVSSVAHRWGHIHFNDINITKRYTALSGYAQSKLAALLCMYERAQRLSGTGVTINALDPGIVGTDIVRNRETGRGALLSKLHKLFFKTPEKAAEMIVKLAASPEYAGVSGKYFARGKAVRSSKRSYDKQAAKAVWKLTEQMAGLCPADGDAGGGKAESIVVRTDNGVGM
jgi:NAD(P)-dependent dehydrogenase (short-subunit alcohol dehydrogenase family)